MLSRLLKMPKILELDEETLAENLLFLNDVEISYAKDTSLVITVC